MKEGWLVIEETGKIDFVSRQTIELVLIARFHHMIHYIASVVGEN